MARISTCTTIWLNNLIKPGVSAVAVDFLLEWGNAVSLEYLRRPSFWDVYMVNVHTGKVVCMLEVRTHMAYQFLIRNENLLSSHHYIHFILPSEF